MGKGKRVGGRQGYERTSQVALVVKEPVCQYRRHERQVQSLGQEIPLKEGMVTHSSILAWTIPWMEEPGGIQSMG